MLMKFMEILVSQGGSQGASQGGSSSARSFDLARPWFSAATNSVGLNSVLRCDYWLQTNTVGCLRLGENSFQFYFSPSSN